MKIYVTGASGFVGRRLVAELTQRGHEVTACVRHASKADDLDASAFSVISEIGPNTDWGDALAGQDAVVHLAARVHVMDDHDADPLAAFRRVNVGGLKGLIAAAINANVGRLITLSSVKAIGEDSATLTAIDDETPAHPADPYGQSKYEADQVLCDLAQESGMGWTVLRPPLVYGPGVRGNFLTLLNACARQKWLPLGAIENQRSMIFLGNLTDGLCATIECAEPLNDVFLIDDDEPISTPDLIQNVSQAMGVSPRMVNVPGSFLRAALGLIRKRAVADRLMGSLVVNSRRFQRVAGWTPPYKMLQGLTETVAWYKSRNDL